MARRAPGTVDEDATVGLAPAGGRSVAGGGGEASEEGTPFKLKDEVTNDPPEKGGKDEDGGEDDEDVTELGERGE